MTEWANMADAFIARFDADWIKAGAPTARETIALVQEIKRLRAELSRDVEARAIIHEAADLVRTRGEIGA